MITAPRPVRTAMSTTPSPEKQAPDRDENLIDEALDESFPASDPATPAVGHGQPRGATATDKSSSRKQDAVG